MTLITAAQRQKLLENGRAQRDAIDRQDQVLDFQPVVKLFTADGNATWLLTELNPGKGYGSAVREQCEISLCRCSKRASGKSGMRLSRTLQTNACCPSQQLDTCGLSHREALCQ